MKTNSLYNYLNLFQKMITYNLRIIFANRFIWFLAGSVIFYLGLSVIYVFDKDVSDMKDLYGVFLFSGILLVFYPTAFGIQNDQDARTIEILFGIPNYRYKVWLLRITLIFAVAFLIMIVFTWLSTILIVNFSFVAMTSQVMFPVVFLGIMAFMLSTVIRNGNGTAVIMIIFGLFFLILGDSALGRSQWNVFLNPYEVPYDVNETTWAIIAFKNRIILSTGSVIFLLFALYNLQKREKFM
jgi:ABC-type transport system involved in multi-copper enzyme maturation permease subunit